MSFCANEFFSILAIACVSAGAAGCEWTTTGDAGSRSRRGGAFTGDPNGCPPDECGMNGTRLADPSLSGLDLDGAPNLHGFAIVGADGIAGSDWASVAVVGGRLVATSPTGAVRDLAGSGVVLEKTRPGGPPTRWRLSIEDAGAVDHMSTEPGAIPTYRLALAPAARPDDRAWVCPDGGAAAIVAGEGYDPLTLAVDDGDIAGRRIHIACEGDLLWKAARMSYDATRAPGDAYHTTAAQRRATLAMLAADYCGTGQRFTTPGTPLYWQNRAGWMRTGGSPSPTATVEAGWSASGAVCLDAPRLAGVHTRADVEAACGRAIPTCSPQLLAASEWITWRPQP